MQYAPCKRPFSGCPGPQPLEKSSCARLNNTSTTFFLYHFRRKHLRNLAKVHLVRLMLRILACVLSRETHLVDKLSMTTKVLSISTLFLFANMSAEQNRKSSWQKDDESKRFANRQFQFRPFANRRINTSCFEFDELEKWAFFCYST